MNFWIYFAQSTRYLYIITESTWQLTFYESYTNIEQCNNVFYKLLIAKFGTFLSFMISRSESFTITDTGRSLQQKEIRCIFLNWFNFQEYESFGISVLYVVKIIKVIVGMD